MPVIDETVNQKARAALVQLLEERPQFRDVKNHHIQDLIPFLDFEEGSAEWLPQFEGNTRALSVLWHNVSHESKENIPTDENAATPVKTRRAASTRKVTPKPKATPPSQSEAEKFETDSLFDPPTLNSQASSNNLSPAELARVDDEEIEPEDYIEDGVIEPEGYIEDGVIEPGNFEVALVQNAPPQLDERTIQASRALADQFAIVQYHEQMLEQANRELNELNEALTRTRQAQINAAQAYTNSLEDLARLMATSLGPKASEFSKLFARMVGGSPGQPNRK